MTTAPHNEDCLERILQDTPKRTRTSSVFYKHSAASLRVGYRRIAFVLFLAIVPSFDRQHSLGHDGSHPSTAKAPQSSHHASSSDGYRQFFAGLIAEWPTQHQEALIAQAWDEHQRVHTLPTRDTEQAVVSRRQKLLSKLEELFPSIEVEWTGSSATLVDPSRTLMICRSIETPVLVKVRNRTRADCRLQPELPPPFSSRAPADAVVVPSEAQMHFVVSALADRQLRETHLPITIHDRDRELSHEVAVPIRLTDPATIRGLIRDGDGRPTPARVIVSCSDGVDRRGGPHANRSTFTEKPIIYPPIGGWRMTRFFYADGSFEITVPPGNATVAVERGFEHKRVEVHVNAVANRTHEVKLDSQTLIDVAKLGWVSGDTHVHWVTNQWNVDEPLELLSMVQRAEGVRVVNNLTLLQRYADQAFIKPSQAPMGPIRRLSNSRFHLQMGEEYRNEDLYGHQCFLNIDWLVQPIGTGSIIAGPDALDYPLNRTAIVECRQQGGINIEAHGTGGNKSVPANVIHRLSDSLDQMEPEMYYRLLDCGFQLPLTNGSDHPARTLGAARAFARIDGPYSYDRWIEAIRRGRTFTSSGPIIFLDVNGAEIGDTVEAGRQEALNISASVVSRDPIGRVEIISNGKVIAESETNQSKLEISCEIPAEESRWVVARCSNRDDGRADFGFGNFNAITGSGVAHTSPIYVEVDGRPRFDPAAAKFWQSRLHDHLGDVRSKGRFATRVQLQEAIDFLQNSIEMFAKLQSNIATARARVESPDDAKERLMNVLRRFGDDTVSTQAVLQLAAAETRGDRSDALKPLVLLAVSVNPESRVKVNARRSKIQLRNGRPQRFLVEVENAAGITAPLNLSALDLSMDPPARADWCTVEIIDSPFTSRYFTGAQNEYKVVQITPHVDGLREVRVIGDAGQGTQDLGFRASTDVLLDIEPKRWRNDEP